MYIYIIIYVYTNIITAGKEDETLWETEEQALKFLLEDGKLNLTLTLTPIPLNPYPLNPYPPYLT